MSESWDEFWTAEVDSLALEMFERSHEPSFTDDARGMGEAREWACRVIDSVRAAARREGQAEAWDEGYDAGELCGLTAEQDDHACPINPYRNGEGQ